MRAKGVKSEGTVLVREQMPEANVTPFNILFWARIRE